MKHKIKKVFSILTVWLLLVNIILPSNYFNKIENVVAVEKTMTTNPATMKAEVTTEKDKSIQTGVTIPQKPDTASGVEKIESDTQNASLETQKQQAKKELQDTKNAKFKSDIIILKVANVKGKTLKENENLLLKKLGKYNISKLDILFSVNDKDINNTLGGNSSLDDKDKNLSTWYRATLKKDTNVVETIKQLLKEQYIISAEPDYIREVKDVGEPTTATDPKMAEQYYLNNLGIKPAWDYLHQQGIPAGGKRDVVVAVIDTGVDYKHPDLAGNMWTNTAEIAGDGTDNDNNGYVDDVHGVSIQSWSKSGDPMDDNGHGTHVAGIIAAQANNNIGGVGVAYNVKIMAIKSGQSSGVFSSSDIAASIYYAADKGADVINMSFGGYGRSTLEEDALQVAFGTSVLVASAGNDGIPNESIGSIPGKPMYPAAYPWVLGVMAESQTPAVNGDNLAGFSNWDASPSNSYEYEVMAPGVSILSTLPGGNYAKWSGTSMATPVVAGIAALVRSRFTDKDAYSSRFIMGQVASTGELKQGITYDSKKPPIFYHEVNAYSALTSTPKPKLSYVESYIFDDKGVDVNNNGDGVINSGETINIAAVIRNHWGKADNVQVKLDTNSSAGIPDPYVTLVTDTVDYGAVGNFAIDDNGLIYTNDVVTGVKNPFVIKVAANTPNDHVIKLNMTITGKNGFDSNDSTIYTTSSSISFISRRATVLPKVISQDMTLTKDNYWLISDKTLIEKGATVTVEPGTKIQFWSTDPSDSYAQKQDAYLQVEGILQVNGTADEPVEMVTGLQYTGYRINISTSSSGMAANGIINLNYAKIMNPTLNVTTVDHCYFSQDLFDNIYYRYFDGSGNSGVSTTSPTVNANNITNSRFYQLGSKYGVLNINSQTQNGNLFDACVYNATLNKAENNVFLKNYKLNAQEFGSREYWVSSVNEIGNTIDSNNAMQSLFPVRNAENGKTYIIVKPYVPVSGYDQLKAVEKYANEFGGHVATIRDANENEFLRGYINNYLNNVTQLKNTYPNIDYSYFYNSSVSKVIIGLNDFDNEGSFKWISGESSSYSNWNSGDPNNKYNNNYESETLSPANFVSIDPDTGLWKDSNDINYGPYSVYIIEVPGTLNASGITLDKKTLTLGAGGSTAKLNAVITPAKTTNTNLIWSSSNLDVAEVDNNGVVTPKAIGTVVITVKTEDGALTDTCQVTVRTIVPATGISLDKISTNLIVGKSDKLTATVMPENCTDKNVIWSSDNKEIVDVDSDGNITAKSEGNAVITVKTNDANYSATCNVTVIVPVTGISLDRNYISLVLGGESATLNPIIEPSTASIKDVTWHSGNLSVATVDSNGVVSSVGIGTALITVITKDGTFKSSSPVTVTSEAISFESTQISAGNGYSTTLNIDGKAYAWGNNSSYKLGDGTNMNRTAPVLINGLTDVICVSAGSDHTSIVKKDGTVWNVSYGSPTQVSNLKDVISVAAGGGYTLALKKDGTVWAWGSNNYGQLGDGSNTGRNEPIQVQNLTNVTSISTSDRSAGFSMALKTDGTVWTWGYNGNGQLGDGTTTNKNIPLQVSSLDGVISIAAGNYHALAVKNDGTVLGWGNQYYYDSSSPVKIQSIDNVKSVSAGEQFSAALKNDGTVWTWGYNTVGQLGNGTSAESYSNREPAQVPNLSDVKAISSGINHTLALKNDGTIMAWGGNESGQLGNLNTTNSAVPVQTLFGMLPDNIPPTVTAATPANGSTEISTNASIILNYSEDIQQSSNFGMIILKDDSGDTISLKSKSIDGNILTLIPINALSVNTKYTVTIPNGAVKDVFNNDTVSAYSSNFTTDATTANVTVKTFALKGNNIATISEETSLGTQTTLAVIGTDEVIDQAAIDTARNSLIESDYFTTVKNNAFLNEWWDANTDHWMRFYATQGRDNRQYLANNYWGTTSTTLIGKAIVDYNSDFNKAKVISTPILVAAPETAYPFVTDINVSTPSEVRTSQVGAEKIKVTVSFNRDMNQNVQPQVSFGPDTPTTDYTLHALNGGWSDARHWVGDFTINPTTGDGYQFFRVAAAQAADDPWLITGNDSERFRFEIITSGTESMKLQASGEEGKVQLSWAQDSFALLAGYNIYRSDSATGTFVKINKTLIPSGENGYDDIDVVPGKIYYYKFTITKTDLAESDYSNMVSATPFDTIPPVISHTPVKGANVGLPLQIFADVTDNVAVKSVSVYYRKTGTEVYTKLAMVNTTGSRYSTTIDGINVKTPGVDYYIEATDGNTIVRNGSVGNPNKVVITDAPKITAISPAEGPATGGTKVVISGSNFKQGSTVTFDGSPASSVVIESDSRITAVSPAHIPSTVDIAVQNSAGYSDTLLRAFSYIKTGVDISIGNAQANTGNLLEIPINISNVAGLVAADFKVNYDKDLLSYQGARTGNITTGFALSTNKNTQGIAQLSMASSSPVNGSGIVAYLQFKVLTSTKITSALTLQDVQLNSGNITVDKTDGTFTLSKTHSVNGTINYYSNSRPVQEFNLTLTGDNPSNTYTSSTGQNGGYSLTTIPNGNYVLKATKSNGVSDITAYDASLILQASAGIITLNANQKIAADVDKNGKIDSMDASYVLQKAAGIIDINSPFPGAGKVWTTVEGEKAYIGFSSDLYNQNLTAILIGDVSGNWGSLNDPLVQSTSKANFSMGTITKEVNGSTYVPVMVAITEGNIFASDIIINYDKNAATVLSVENTGLTTNFALAFNTSTPGVIRISSAGAIPISSSGMLFRIRFNSTSDKTLEATTNIISASVNENAIASIINAPADVNSDKVIDIIDLTNLTPNYNKTKTDEGWNDSLDINQDGVVDIFDFVLISKKITP